MSGKRIAFFDFDGTITTKDSLMEIIKFTKGRMYCYTGLLLHLPWLIAYTLDLIPNDRAKERLLTYFFGGMSESVFQKNCDLFSDSVLPGMIRPNALSEIEQLRKRGFEIIIVTASADNWIRKWSDKLSLHLVATKLEVRKGLITGKIQGRNCQGEQKVARIQEKWNLSEYEEIYAYGDSPGDKPMLALASKSFYQPFRTA